VTYEEVLSAVRDRVSRFATYSDPEDVLDPAGTRDIAALWGATSQKLPEMWHAVGLLHYTRHLLNSAEAERELSESMLDRVRDDFPDIPEQQRKLREAVGKPVKPYPHRLSVLAFSGSLDELNYVIFEARQHIRTLDAGTNELWRARMDLAKAHQLRFFRTQDLEDVDAAIDMVTELMEATPTSNPNYPEAPSVLGGLWQFRYSVSSAPEDLDRSVELLRKALATNAETHENHPMHQSNLGRALVLRSTVTARRDGDLDEGLDLLTKAVATTPQDDFGLGTRLTALQEAHYARFERDHNAADLDAMVELGYAAVNATPPEHPDYVERFIGVSGAHFTRYLATRHKDDVKAAISVARRVIKGTRRDDPYHMLAKELLKAARAAR
jgi:hypothetical protein